MEVIERFKWRFPPILNRKGRTCKKHSFIDIIVSKSSLFKQPVIAMSDMHDNTPKIVEKLNQFFKLQHFVVLSTGDMAGTGVYGSDDDPTPSYEYLSKLAKEYYFVQGNHDLPCGINKGFEKKIKNKQNKLCMIQNGDSVKSLIGKIAGVNGIISDKKHPYKMSHDKYITYLKKGLQKKPYILMTHDTPSIKEYIGNADILATTQKYKPNIHLYGHCHHPTFYNVVNGVKYINLDKRIIIFIPVNEDIDQYLSEELRDIY